MFRSLASRDYRIWFVGALVSNIGAWMQATAQNWVVLTELTDTDALAVGITMALQFAPQLLLVPVTGLIADRFDRRKILMVTQSSLMVLGLALGLLLVFGQAELWHLYGFALLLGLVNAVDMPARQTFVADLVSSSHMSNAVALNSASFNAARLIGPAMAGLLIVLVGSGWVFVINAATFLGVLVALVMLRNMKVQRMPRPARSGGQFVAGFRYVAGRPDLVIVFVIVFLIGAFGMNFPIFSSTMAVEFGRGAGEYGVLSSILAIGSLTGALLAARRERARMRIIILASAFFGASVLVAALMPTYWTFAASTILIGFGAVSILTTANGYVQTTTDPELRGRVMALYMAILVGGTPIGAPIVGAVADTWGPRWALGLAAVAAGAAALIGVGWLVFARGMHLARHPRAAWRPVVRFADAPTAAIAVVPTRPLRVVRDRAAELADRDRDREGELVPPVPNDRLVPADFSEQVALTSPIPLPKAHHEPPPDTGSHYIGVRKSRSRPGINTDASTTRAR
ncbi:MFS transporter [Agromyces sp. Soil535]|uniref:MFS transporter n=1 Tax=Agromyces sp. Soil535 TaxID=1736390 RepID=UPI0007014A7E|nr:MFS transporter [Agromyces sp. Soil535]KRE31386.1 MFS transporter [Agromyces sp. Soil535]